MEELVLKDTRKTFWWAYAGVIAIITLTVYLKTKNTALTKEALILSGITIIVGLLLPEIARAWKVCRITRERIEIISGILHRRHRSLASSSVAEVHVHQTFAQRLLNYGRISISSAVMQQEIELGIFNRPRRVVAEIEEIRGLSVKRTETKKD